LPEDADLGGTEQAIIHLSAALAARGHRIVTGPADVTVAINDATLLPAGGGLPIVWFHNEVEFWRELKKRRLPDLWRHRPAAAFIGTEQARLASRLLPFRARGILPYGVPASVLNAVPADAPPPPHAVFTSQAYRGLAEIIKLWHSLIAPRNAQARLTAYIAATDIPHYRTLAAGTPSIRLQPRAPNHAMPGILRGARLLFAPGHRAETFCLAAAEAVTMGVPVLTLGIGSLKERVDHGHTGFICNTLPEMAARAGRLLTDDVLWQSMHAHGLATRKNSDWDRAASRWESFVDTAARRPA